MCVGIHCCSGGMPLMGAFKVVLSVAQGVADSAKDGRGAADAAKDGRGAADAAKDEGGAGRVVVDDCE